MEIKKGDWFKCIQDLRMKKSGKREYNKGRYYKSEVDGCITNDSGNAHHQWTDNCKPKVSIIFMKLFTLQDLNDGKCAVVDWGMNMLEDINKILKSADIDKWEHEYEYPFTFIDNENKGFLTNADSTKLPSQSVYDFLPQIENKEEFPKVGVTDKPLRFTQFPAKEKPSESIEPNHYGGKNNPLEAIKIIQHYKLSFELGNVLKYILRHDKKGMPLQDLEKAKRCLEYEISKYN